MKDLRVNYTKSTLLESMVDTDPIVQFKNWFKDCSNSEIKEPNAMVLSTATAEKVNSRTVLLKDLRDGEFHFYTNYRSHKGIELEQNALCSLLFPWYPLERQVIVRGSAYRLSEADSDAYFSSRPFKSQLGAWVSNQSKLIESRENLEKRFAEITKRFESEKMHRPPHWGGFGVIPKEIEFWQGGANRLHDRIVFQKNDEKWVTSRLQP